MRHFLAAAILLASSPALSRPRLSVGAEVGVAGYTGALGEAVRRGGSWGLRAQAAVASPFSLGLAYEGSANRVQGFEGPAAPQLARHAWLAFVRLEPEGGLVAPFLEAGLGAASLRAVRGAPGPVLRDDWVLEIPAGAGLRIQAAGLSAGLRLTWRRLVGNQLLAGGGGDLVGTSLVLGARF